MKSENLNALRKSHLHALRGNPSFAWFLEQAVAPLVASHDASLNALQTKKRPREMAAHLKHQAKTILEWAESEWKSIEESEQVQSD